MNSIDFNILRLSAQRALLFNISTNMRYVLIGLNKKGEFKIKVYFHKAPTEEEMELIYAFSGEVTGDFVELIDSDVEAIVTDEKIISFDKELYMIFAKCEYEVR